MKRSNAGSFGRFLLMAIAVAVVASSSACGDHPAGLATKFDIANTPADKERIAIPFLPIEDYPALAEYKNLVQISYFSIDVTGGTNAKLEGTSITDASMKTVVEEINITGINVANCPKVTFVGIKLLARSKSLTELGIDGNNLTQAQVLELIGDLPKSIEFFNVVDLKRKLDRQALEKVALKWEVPFVLSESGALQDMKVKPKP
jgi:hypothetical protein